MSRTVRAYNKPDSPFGIWVVGGIGWIAYWHPYKQLDTGTPSGVHKGEHAKIRRLTYKKQLETELRNLCDYEHFNACADCVFYQYDIPYDEVCEHGFQI